MKNKLVKLIRKILPKNLATWLAQAYRSLRLKLVTFYYGNPARSLKTIAVTGTNGKTTTLCLINQIFKTAGYKTAMFSTAVIELAGESKMNDLNLTTPTTAGLQRFLRAAKQAKVDFVLLEATSQALDQQKLPKLNLEVAIFTNLTQDHLDYHKTLDNYAFAKSRLWKMQPKYSVVNLDDAFGNYFAQFDPRERLVTYGVGKKATLKIAHATLFKKGSDIVLETDDRKLELGTSLPGQFNVYNVAAAVGAALCVGVTDQVISEAVAELKTVPGRQQAVENDLGVDILVDYAHTPDALEKLLDFAQATAKGKISLVFGACGDRDRTKRPIMGRIAAEKADRLFVTDEENYHEDAAQIRQMILEGVKEVDPQLDKTLEAADRRAAIEAALAVADPGDMILITGLGHEQFRVIDGVKTPWQDTEIVKEILAKLAN